MLIMYLCSNIQKIKLYERSKNIVIKILTQKFCFNIN